MTDHGRQDGGTARVDDLVSDAEIANGMRTEADDASYHAAWRAFVDRHLPSLKAFIEARARDLSADTCDDLLSEAVARIQRGVDKYVDRGPGKLRSWCFAIAQSVLDDVRRGRLRHLQDETSDMTLLVSFEEVEERYGASPVGHSEAGLSDAEARCAVGDPPPFSDLSEVLRAFSSLNDVDQAVIWCKVVQGDSDAYVAEITGKPVDHVRKIRLKAVNKLRKRVDQLLANKRQAS